MPDPQESPTAPGLAQGTASASRKATLTVARAIAQTLSAYGVTHYFCVTGGDHDLWLALDEVGIGIVNCRSEAAAAYMADGYARISGRPGMVYGQRGPGASNVAAAMADAYWALSPVVALTSSIHMPARDRFQYQDVDTLPQYEPATIWNRSLSAPAHAAAMVRAALRAATGPVPGPVHLEIPADMLTVECADVEIYAESRAGMVGRTRIQPRPDELTELAKRMREAQRPLLLAGKGVHIADACAELAQLAESLSIPVATTLGGKGAIADDSPLAVGVVGRYSRRVANEVLRDCDMVIALGTRLGGLATHGWKLPFDEKRIVQVDADPQVIGHNFHTELGVVGDLKLALGGLVQLAGSQNGDGAREAWAQDVAEYVQAWQMHADALVDQEPADGIHPARVLHELRAAMSPDDVLVADTGGIAAWAGTLFPVKRGRTFLRSAGSLGWALPGALGAALAHPQQRTVCLIGDGGLLYFVGEFETMMRQDIPVVIVLLNNQAFASEHHLLKNIWGTELPAVTDFHDVDFAQVASGFGLHATTVSDARDLSEALADAIAEERPALVDIRISKEAQAPAEHFRGEDPI